MKGMINKWQQIQLQKGLEQKHVSLQRLEVQNRQWAKAMSLINIFFTAIAAGMLILLIWHSAVFFGIVR